MINERHYIIKKIICQAKIMYRHGNFIAYYSFITSRKELSLSRDGAENVV